MVEFATIEFSLDRLLAILGIVFTVVLSIVAIVQTHRAKRERNPYYSIEKHSMLTKEFSSVSDKKLRLTYGDEVISSISKLSVTVWNSGREAIRPIDILATPRIIVPEGSRILAAHVSALSRKEVAFAIGKSEDNSLEFSFAVLDFKDGVAIDLLVEGEPEKTRIEGSFVGAPQGFRLTDVRTLPSGDSLNERTTFHRIIEVLRRQGDFLLIILFGLQVLIPIVLGVVLSEPPPIVKPIVIASLITFWVIIIFLFIKKAIFLWNAPLWLHKIDEDTCMSWPPMDVSIAQVPVVK
jgi:hypothetical protein